jgi:hypothetical protein
VKKLCGIKTEHVHASAARNGLADGDCRRSEIGHVRFTPKSGHRNDSEMARGESDAQPHQPLLAPQIEPAGFCESLSGMLIPKQALKSGRRQLGVSDGVLDRLVAEIALDGPRIDAVICQLVAAAMPQHVRMDFHVEARRAGRALYHGLEAAG